MPFVKGQSGNIKGREKGKPNKLTATVRGTVLDVFTELQADPKHNLKAFAKANPKEFYLIASKLIPTEITGTTTQVFRVITEEEAEKENLSNE